MTLVTSLVFGWIAFLLTGPVLLGWWVFLDASSRGGGRPLLWALTSVLLLIPGIVYLRHRHRLGPRAEPIGRTERAVATALLAVLSGILGWVAFPDPTLAGLYGIAFVPAGVLVGYVRFWRGDRSVSSRH